jgi:predicted AAA+ superfamily ATPase
MRLSKQNGAAQAVVLEALKKQKNFPYPRNPSFLFCKFIFVHGSYLDFFALFCLFCGTSTAAIFFKLNQQLETFLRFGAYPDVFSLPNQADKVQFLTQLTRSYLYKDILELSTIKHPDKIKKLLQLLAFQAGAEVSLKELGNTLQMSKKTLASYIDLLEKAFVVFRLSSFSRNLRKEVAKMDKVYFYDLGVSNALINNFNTLDFCTDVGQLWENFLVVERLKNMAYGVFAILQKSTYFRFNKKVG